MTSIQVFDPAMCCNTGVCGEDVDQALVTFTAWEADLLMRLDDAVLAAWARRNGWTLGLIGFLALLLLFTTTAGDHELTQYLRDVGDECETLEAVQIGSFNEISGEWDLQQFIGNPTHWQPLPLPPAPKEVERT